MILDVKKNGSNERTPLWKCEIAGHLVSENVFYFHFVFSLLITKCHIVVTFNYKMSYCFHLFPIYRTI